MSKKLFAVLTAMALMTALVAALMIGCGKTPQTTQTTATTDSVGTTQDAEQGGENVQVSVGVDERPVDETTGSATQETTGKKPVENTPDTTESQQTPTVEPVLPSGGPNLELTYEQYLNMSGAEQTEYFNSFGEGDQGALAFIAWFDKAKEEYQKENQAIIATGDGSLNLEDYINP